MAKSFQAKSLWKPATPSHLLQAKDNFIEESGSGYTITVLRDGSVEIRSSRSKTVEDMFAKIGNFTGNNLRKV